MLLRNIREKCNFPNIYIVNQLYMKKLIITENQKMVIENHLLVEAGEDQGKKEKFQKLSERISAEFGAKLRQAKVNTGLTLIFGKTDDKSQIIEDSVVTYGTIVVKVDETNKMVLLAVGAVDYIQGAIPKIPVKTVIAIPFEKPVLLGVSCRLNMFMVTNYDPENDQNIGYQHKLVADFLTFEFHGDLKVKRLNPTPGEQPAPSEDPETIDIDYTEAPGEQPLTNDEINAVYGQEGKIKNLGKTQSKRLVTLWNQRCLDILRSMEFEPAMFHMNNFFFFPRGYAVMDDILRKYGMKTPRDNKGSISIMVVGKPVGDKNNPLLTNNKLLRGKIKRGYIESLYTNNTGEKRIIIFKLVQNHDVITEGKILEVWAYDCPLNYRGIEATCRKLNQTKIKIVRM